MDALQFVQACLERSPVSTRDIAEGSGVGESWLQKFRRGEIPDPGYSRVKLLADYFLRAGEVPALVEGHTVKPEPREGAR